MPEYGTVGHHYAEQHAFPPFISPFAVGQAYLHSHDEGYRPRHGKRIVLPWIEQHLPGVRIQHDIGPYACCPPFARIFIYGSDQIAHDEAKP